MDGFQKRVGHSSSDDELIHFIQHVLNQLDLILDFGTEKTGHNNQNCKQRENNTESRPTLPVLLETVAQDFPMLWQRIVVLS